MAKTTKNRKINVRDKEKYEYAYLLFMKGTPQKDICTKINCSPTTLQSWIETGGWKEKRSVRNINIDTLIAKTLQKINDILDSEEGFNADAFSKAVNQLKTLKKGASIDDKIHAFMEFGDWLMDERIGHPEIDEGLIKRVTELQDRYILQSLKNG